MVNGDHFGGEKRIGKVKMFQKMNYLIYPQHLQTFFHKNILENLTLQFFPGKAFGSFSVSHLTDPLMHTEAVKTGDIQILLRSLYSSPS